MKARIRSRSAALAMGLLLTALPLRAMACATCYGQSDSPLAEGMNWGIFALLIVVMCVLAGIASFFVFLARRASSVAASELPTVPDSVPGA